MAYKRRLRFDKRIKFQKKMNIIYILLLIVLASIGTGYAYIKSNLYINGTANVTAASWDVHFENLQVTTGSVTATTPANITDDTTVEFSAELAEPNDFYEFTVDVANEGTMDAMIDSFSISPTLTTAQAKYLEYTVSYSDGTPLANKQELKADTSENLKVRFSYIENEDKTNYPTEDQTFTISFSVDYTQADSTAQSVGHPQMVYTIGNTNTYIGQAIPGTITQYATAEEAMTAFERVFCLGHKLQNDIVSESYVNFTVLQNMVNNYPDMALGMYSIKGGVNETDLITKPVYEANKEEMTRAFGSANCEDNSTNYYCMISGLNVIAYPNGYVRASGNERLCYVDSTRYSVCSTS